MARREDAWVRKHAHTHISCGTSLRFHRRSLFSPPPVSVPLRCVHAWAAVRRGNSGTAQSREEGGEVRCADLSPEAASFSPAHSPS